jgi:uncharacterized membrane protein YkgB
MGTIKGMSIAGIVISALSFFCLIAYSDYDNIVFSTNYMSGIGWGMIGAIYLLAFSITGLVIACQKKEIK